jgi:hypothetical protein
MVASLLALLFGAAQTVAVAASDSTQDHRPCPGATVDRAGHRCTNGPKAASTAGTGERGRGRLPRPRGRPPRPAPPPLGTTVLLSPRTRTSSCQLGVLPDRRCSPGAYNSGLSQALLCSPGFRPGPLARIPEPLRRAAETEYGLPPNQPGRPVVIDQIVPAQLGGATDIANLFPEPTSGQYNAADKIKLETRLRQLVCSGHFSLTAARTAIALNWRLLYRLIFHTHP